MLGRPFVQGLLARLLAVVVRLGSSASVGAIQYIQNLPPKSSIHSRVYPAMLPAVVERGCRGAPCMTTSTRKGLVGPLADGRVAVGEAWTDSSYSWARGGGRTGGIDSPAPLQECTLGTDAPAAKAGVERSGDPAPSRAAPPLVPPLPGLTPSTLDEHAAATKPPAMDVASTTLRMPVASNKRRAVRLACPEVDRTGGS